MHKLDDTVNGEKPELVKVTLELGLKIPMLYRITATMTMIRIAQPYVIIYSKADCDLLFFTVKFKCLVVCVCVNIYRNALSFPLLYCLRL